MKKFILFLLVSVSMVAMAQTTDYSINLSHHFQFPKDRPFRLMQLSDIQDNSPLHVETQKFIQEQILEQKPDLIILTGDNVNVHNKHGKFELSVQGYISIFNNYSVPFAITFGNHDSEYKGPDFYTRQEQYDLFRKFGGKNFVDYDIPDLTGVGSGAIPLYSSSDSEKPAFNVILMDSGDYAKPDGYDGCHTDQIKWYEEHAGVLPALWFQHIIVYDIFETGLTEDVESRQANTADITPVVVTEGTPNAVFDENLKAWIEPLPEGAWWSPHLKKYIVPEEGMDWNRFLKAYYIHPEGSVFNHHTNKYIKLASHCTGVLGEGCCPPKKYVYVDELHTFEGRTLYQSWMKMNNVKGAFFGHDHINSFDGVDKNGMRLGACPSATACSYHNGNFGALIFDINEDGTYKKTLIQVPISNY